jgi:hypothetical protein
VSANHRIAADPDILLEFSFMHHLVVAPSTLRMVTGNVCNPPNI